MEIDRIAPTQRPADRVAGYQRWLERALIANFVIHGVALLAMAALLLPVLPGGSASSDVERIAMIAAHPWRFRIGWLPWQLCAVADIGLAVAMVRVPWLARVPARVVLVLTLAAVVPDQYAQAMWITRGVELAHGDPAVYLAFERTIFPLTAVWGALLYTLAALAWTWCFAAAGTWSRALSILSVPLWLTMFVAVTSPLAGASPAFTSIANGAGFLQLQLWLALVTEQVLRRARPFEAHGRLARWRHPGRGPLARGADAIANSRLASVLFAPIPELAMCSDITDVVYVNYLVSAEAAQRLVPPGLVLQRLGPTGRWALFTFLIYRHGHLGFAFLGPLRKLLPSPIQTNWRIHVTDPVTGHRGIYFVTNAVTHTLQALIARLVTEACQCTSCAASSCATATPCASRSIPAPARLPMPSWHCGLRMCPSSPVHGQNVFQTIDRFWNTVCHRIARCRVSPYNTASRVRRSTSGFHLTPAFRSWAA